MEFDKDHIALLAGLIDEDDFEQKRQEIAENVVIKRQKEDLEDFLGRTHFSNRDEPESHVDPGVLKEGILDGTWSKETIIEYLGFDPSEEENDSDFPEHPGQPTASEDSKNPNTGDWKYSKHSTPGYEDDPEATPAEQMKTLRDRQEKSHWKTQLGIRGPGAIVPGQEEEIKESNDKFCQKYTFEPELLRETVLRRWATNESTDEKDLIEESITMGFPSLGFGQRTNPEYTGWNSVSEQSWEKDFGMKTEKALYESDLDDFKPFGDLKEPKDLPGEKVDSVDADEWSVLDAKEAFDQDRQGEFYVEFDDDLQQFGVFGSESGFCYAGFSDKEDAQESAKSLNKLR